MYSNRLGRFTTVDKVFARAGIVSPQSWNRYTYVMNNPLLYTDPTGLIWVKEAGCKDEQCQPIWIANDVWEKMSGDEQGDYEEITEMEYDSAQGRVRLDPNGPSDGNQGWAIIGPNVGSGAGVMLGTAVVTSQVDSPAPGPADVAAVGMAILALYQLSIYTQYGVPYSYDPNIYSVSKHNKELVEGLVGAAETEIEKLRYDPPTGGARNHHKGEIKAMLDRAKNIADRLILLCQIKTKRKICRRRTRKT